MVSKSPNVCTQITPIMFTNIDPMKMSLKFFFNKDRFLLSG